MSAIGKMKSELTRLGIEYDFKQEGRMSPTQQERRIQAIYDDANVSRRYLCERVVHLEADMEDVAALLRDVMAEASRAARGFSVHPKRYRDLYSRAKKLGVYDDEQA